MRYKTPLAIAAVVALAMGGIALQWPALSASFAPPSANGRQPGVNSEGSRRDDVLKSLTRAYVARGDQVSAQMTAGSALAPVDYLTSELGRQGAKWRVRAATGQDVEIFDVS